MVDDSNNFFSKRKKDDSDKFIVKWGITALVISILAIGVIFFTGGTGSLDALFSKVTNNVSKLPFVGGRQNILILGVDSNGKDSDPFIGTRSDTIILVNFDPMSRTVNALSIPRDSKVYIAENNGIDKINAAHAIGGPELTIKTIQDTFGVRVDHYIVINYAGVKELVNALGGVTVNVEKRMRYRDRAAGLRIDLEPGLQTLDADQAEQYLRYRHDAIGDIGRMQRQQWFVRGVMEKFKSPQIITKIPELVSIADKYVKTDMNVYDMSKYASYLGALNLDKVQVSTIPGTPSQTGHISYWIIDPEKAQEVIDKVIYRDVYPSKPGPLTVSILYHRSHEDKISGYKAELEKLGYQVNCMNRTKNPHYEIVGHSRYVNFNDTKDIKKAIPALKSAPFIISPDNYLCGESDISIVIPRDVTTD